MTSGENRTVLDLLKDGKLKKELNYPVDSRIYDPDTDQPILVGNTDPNIIGADDTYSFAYRDAKAYPNVPQSVKDAEMRFILPMAKHLAGILGITVLDETAYERVLQALRTRSLFVLLNLHKVKVADGIASWFGLILTCKRHPIVLVNFKLKLSTGQIGIDQVRLWNSSSNSYIIRGPNVGPFFSREEASALVLNYLRGEGVVPTI